MRGAALRGAARQSRSGDAGLGLARRGRAVEVGQCVVWQGLARLGGVRRGEVMFLRGNRPWR